MTTVESIQAALRDYHDKYRNPGLRKLKVSEPYSLFPNGENSAVARYQWPETWPNNEHPGIYFMLSKRDELLYVGKAALLGARLQNYFRYGSDKECELKQSWPTTPYLLITVAVDEPFEASSLEEYLIARPKPTLNKTWSKRDDEIERDV